ncbi:MAG: FAD-binding protein [Dehalococcoidia bacterium]|nr:FAD-binding protein [Dehalococcoidia bacterium]
MPYTPELNGLLKEVERTRPARLALKRSGGEFPMMSLREREQMLAYHPDYKDEGKRALLVGPSKGYRVAHEFADILEAWSRVDPEKVDLSEIRMETDVLVIGGGGAGTSAALIAEENGARVTIATKLRHGDANTMMAEGGIQAATKPGKDSPYYHYLDTIGGGHFQNDPELVRTLVTEAPRVMAWLESIGVMFDKFPDGTLMAVHGGGTSRKRMHPTGDITGAELMRTIRDETRNRPNIDVIEYSPVVELVLNEHGQCAGALLYNLETEEYFIIKAKAVILATGGCGRLHVQGFGTTNHYGATADGLVLGYRAGVALALLHTVQYHPTGAVYPEQVEGLLISEKFRTSGANLVNIKGEQFVNEREPRDIESSCCIRECKERGLGIPTPAGRVGAWLDSPMIDMIHGEGTVRHEFPGKHILFKRHGIDIAREPMLVYPTLHYQNGGLKISLRCETTVPGLFAAGEVTGGVHGENRLAGNSLMDVFVFGRIAGKNAVKYLREQSQDGNLTLEHVKKFQRELETAGIPQTRVSPMLLPEYTGEAVKKRQWTAGYLGTLR